MRLKRIFIINMAILAGMLALSIWTWGQLPPDSRIPVRFDLEGAPLAYMGKARGLLLTPLITFFMISSEKKKIK